MGIKERLKALSTSVVVYVILALVFILFLIYLFKDNAYEKAYYYNQIKNGYNSEKTVNRIYNNPYYQANIVNKSYTGSYIEDFLSDGDIDGVNANEVIKLQEFLLSQGYPIKADGIFRRSTKLALKDFQAKHNLKADGVFGDETKKVINSIIEGF